MLQQFYRLKAVFNEACSMIKEESLTSWTLWRFLGWMNFGPFVILFCVTADDCWLLCCRLNVNTFLEMDGWLSCNIICPQITKATFIVTPWTQHFLISTFLSPIFMGIWRENSVWSNWQHFVLFNTFYCTKLSSFIGLSINFGSIFCCVVECTADNYLYQFSLQLSAVFVIQ